jgi:hypothetical protein
VYRSIFQNLKGIALRDSDEYARFNTGFIVYHDDIGDYSTNEPIMDGTASLLYLVSGYAVEGSSCDQRPEACVSSVASESVPSKSRAGARKKRRGN